MRYGKSYILAVVPVLGIVLQGCGVQSSAISAKPIRRGTSSLAAGVGDVTSSATADGTQTVINNGTSTTNTGTTGTTGSTGSTGTTGSTGSTGNTAGNVIWSCATDPRFPKTVPIPGTNRVAQVVAQVAESNPVYGYTCDGTRLQVSAATTLASVLDYDINTGKWGRTLFFFPNIISAPINTGTQNADGISVSCTPDPSALLCPPQLGQAAANRCTVQPTGQSLVACLLPCPQGQVPRLHVTNALSITGVSVSCTLL